MSAKLSGDKNLTLDSIVDIADAAGAAVDLVFRPAGSPRARQMWEASSETDREMDHARALLEEVEEMHAETRAMHETLSSAMRMAFRDRQRRELARGFAVRAVSANDDHAQHELVVNGF